MNDARLITPFSSDIDRDAFGHWLSGFTDGEGCFHLECARNGNHTRLTPAAKFILKLRADDLPILHQIQSYWQCGRCRIYRYRPGATRLNAKPAAIFEVSKAIELGEIIIPHFEKYPLRAKKQADYLIWKQAVELMAFGGPLKRLNIQGPDGRLLGTLPKWSEEERALFLSLSLAIQAQRKYRPPD